MKKIGFSMLRYLQLRFFGFGLDKSHRYLTWMKKNDIFKVVIENCPFFSLQLYLEVKSLKWEKLKISNAVLFYFDKERGGYIC